MTGITAGGHPILDAVLVPPRGARTKPGSSVNEPRLNELLACVVNALPIVAHAFDAKGKILLAEGQVAALVTPGFGGAIQFGLGEARGTASAVDILGLFIAQLAGPQSSRSTPAGHRCCQMPN